MFVDFLGAGDPGTNPALIEPAVLANTSGPAQGDIPVKAATASPQVMQVTSVHGVLAQNPETLSYDADGNLTADGLWDYTYDADGVWQHGDGQFQRNCPSGRAERGGPLGREARQNRLIKMQTGSAAITAGLPGKRLIFRYDSLGRRTTKAVWTYSGSTWT